jgi:hypothetical protein
LYGIDLQSDSFVRLLSAVAALLLLELVVMDVFKWNGKRVWVVGVVWAVGGVGDNAMMEMNVTRKSRVKTRRRVRIGTRNVGLEMPMKLVHPNANTRASCKQSNGIGRSRQGSARPGPCLLRQFHLLIHIISISSFTKKSSN